MSFRKRTTACSRTEVCFRFKFRFDRALPDWHSLALVTLSRSRLLGSSIQLPGLLSSEGCLSPIPPCAFTPQPMLASVTGASGCAPPDCKPTACFQLILLFLPANSPCHPFAPLLQVWGFLSISWPSSNLLLDLGSPETTLFPPSWAQPCSLPRPFPMSHSLHSDTHASPGLSVLWLLRREVPMPHCLLRLGVFQNSGHRSIWGPCLLSKVPRDLCRHRLASESHLRRYTDSPTQEAQRATFSLYIETKYDFSGSCLKNQDSKKKND